MNFKTPSCFYNLNLIKKLTSTLESLIPENRPKDIILNEKLFPIFRVNKQLVENLKEKKIKLCFFEKTDPHSYLLESENLVVLISNKENELNELIYFMNALVEKKTKLTLKIYFFIYPQSTYLAKVLIKKQASKKLKECIANTGEIIIRSLSFDFFPIDDDLLSLEYALTSQELFWRNEFNLHNLCAEAIYKFQIAFGKFKESIFIGENPLRIKKILENIYKENGNYIDTLEVSYESCIVIDRGMDLFTPFMTQFTYLGLLDEIFNLNFGTLDINKTVIDKYASPSEIIKYNLFSEDDKSEFQKLKNCDCITLISKVQEIATKIKNNQNIPDNIDEEKAKELIEIIKFSNFGSVHINLTTKVMDFLKRPQIVEKNKIQQALLKDEKQSYVVEDLIEMIQVNVELEIIISLIICINFVFAGYSAKNFKNLSQEFVNNYGLDKINILLILNQKGLFIDKNNPKHILNKESNFKLYQNLFKNYDNKSIDTNYNKYVSPLVNIFKSVINNDNIISNFNYQLGENSKIENISKSKKIFLFVIGGLTYSEIISIRKIAEENNKEVILAVSNIVNTKSILQGLL